MSVGAQARIGLGGFSLRRGALHCCVRRLMFAQRTGNEYHRLDLHVRLLAIEEHLGENDFGFELYERFLEYKRVDQRRRSRSHSLAGFLSLVMSVQRNGFDRAHPLEIGTDRVLRHGAHRLSCAVAFGFQAVPVRVDPRASPRPDYSEGRLRRIGLNRNDLERIVDAKRRYEATLLRWRGSTAFNEGREHGIDAAQGPSRHPSS